MGHTVKRSESSRPSRRQATPSRHVTTTGGASGPTGSHVASTRRRCPGIVDVLSQLTPDDVRTLHARHRRCLRRPSSGTLDEQENAQVENSCSSSQQSSPSPPPATCSENAASVSMASIQGGISPSSVRRVLPPGTEFSTATDGNGSASLENLRNRPVPYSTGDDVTGHGVTHLDVTDYDVTQVTPEISLLNKYNLSRRRNAISHESSTIYLMQLVIEKVQSP